MGQLHLVRENIASIFFLAGVKQCIFSLALFLEGIKLFWLKLSEGYSAQGRQHGKF